MPIFKRSKMILQNNKKIIPLLLLGVGVIFIVMGINRGEVAIVFNKAVRVCLECIGIG